jgi:hypothetical protein
VTTPIGYCFHVRPLFVLVLVSATAAAQPGVVPPAASYRPRLDPDDQRVLDTGEISNGRQVLGTAFAIWPGFGLGQVAEGRWTERGWIFTFGEAGSLGVYAIGATCALASKHASCSDTNYGIAVAGVISLVVFHVAGVLDAAIAPPFHNRRVRELRARIAPSQGGLALQF